MIARTESTPNRCLVCTRPANLHESTRPEDGVVYSTLCQELLGAGLDVHQWDLWMLVAAKDGEEDVSLNPHRLRQERCVKKGV